VMSRALRSEGVLSKLVLLSTVAVQQDSDRTHLAPSPSWQQGLVHAMPNRTLNLGMFHYAER
jgi:hypothetical protein